MHTHTHAYLLSYDRSRIILGNSQIPSQIQRQRRIEVSGNAATICCAMSSPTFRYLGTDTSRGQARDRQIVVPCAAPDKREALLGGSLVSFKFLVIIAHGCSLCILQFGVLLFNIISSENKKAISTPIPNGVCYVVLDKSA